MKNKIVKPKKVNKDSITNKNTPLRTKKFRTHHTVRTG